MATCSKKSRKLVGRDFRVMSVDDICTNKYTTTSLFSIIQIILKLLLFCFVEEYRAMLYNRLENRRIKSIMKEMKRSEVLGFSDEENTVNNKVRVRMCSGLKLSLSRQLKVVVFLFFLFLLLLLLLLLLLIIFIVYYIIIYYNVIIVIVVVLVVAVVIIIIIIIIVISSSNGSRIKMALL